MTWFCKGLLHDLHEAEAGASSCLDRNLKIDAGLPSSECHARRISDCRWVQVDTRVHHSACMHQKHLLRFIKSKLRKEPDEVVIFRDGKYLTLMEVFESLNLTG